MRFIVCLMIGAIVGALLATTAAGILRPKQSYPRALMVVIKEEMKQARGIAKDNNCAGIEKPLNMLGLLADDIESAIPHGDPPDRVFRQYSEDFRKKVRGAIDGSGNCTAQREALVEVSNACEACHRDYR